MSRIKQADLVEKVAVLEQRLADLESHLLFFLRAQGSFGEAPVQYGAENMGRLAAKIEDAQDSHGERAQERIAGFQRRLGEVWGAAWVPPASGEAS